MARNSAASRAKSISIRARRFCGCLKSREPGNIPPAMSIDRAQRQRREIKYMIREEQALAVRSYLNSYLEADEFAVGKPDNSYSVHSVYLDSNRLATYHSANNGERNRFKLRIRYYDENPWSPVFFEIKRRINEGIV